MDPVPQVLLILSALLVLGAAGEAIFSRTGIPDAIWLVVAGILLGPASGLISPQALEPAVPIFGAVALTVILSGGAYRIHLVNLITAAPRGLLLSTIGFVFSLVAICLFLWIATALGWVAPAPPIYWVMMGAIVGGSSSLIILPAVQKSGVDKSVGSTLEVESSATDALCVVVAITLIDLVKTGVMDIPRLAATLAQQLGIGVALGIVTFAVMIPILPRLRNATHSYTVFLAAMLGLYGVTTVAQGNGAIAVLIAALLMGNAKSLVPRLIPGARPASFDGNDTSTSIQDHMTFVMKSFFFVLIGLMFPSDWRLIGLGMLAAVFLFLLRFAAVSLSMWRSDLSKKQYWLLSTAAPRGLAAGVLATMPLAAGVPHMENLSPAVFALIVTSILLFTLGWAVIRHLFGSK